MDFFDWFQITVLILFYTVFMGKTVFLRLKGIKPFVLGIGKRGFDALLEIFFFFGLALWSFEVISHSTNFDIHIFRDIFLFEILSLKVFGVVIIIVGFAIFISSLVSFGSSWRVGIDRENPGGMVTGGVFSVTRNPIFLFIDLYFLGTFLIYPSPFFCIATVIVITGMHYQIIQEEKFLKKEYGDEYLEYMSSVRRYI